MKPIFIFGISGATWELIDPLLAAGELPAMKSLIDRGFRATLKSARVADDKHYRPQIAWPTLATGMGPEKNGVTKFFHTADDVRVPSIWERVEQAGGKAGLFGWPITWPVRPVKGFMIPGYDGRDPATWPGEYSFIRTLDRRQEAARGGRDTLSKLPFSDSLGLVSKLIRGGVRPSTFLKLAASGIDIKTRAPKELRPLLQRHARLEISTDIFLKLCRETKPDFSAFISFLVDYTSHRFWLFHSPERFADAPKDVPARLHSALNDAYRSVDRSLGRILKTMSDDTIIAVVSEHGMAIEEVSAEIGPWHWVLRPGKIKEFVGLDPAMPAVPVARWIAFRPPADQMEEVARKFGEIKIEGTDKAVFQTHIHNGEVILKLALWRGELSGRDELETLRVQYGDRKAGFKELAQVFGRRRSAMHAEDAVMILAGKGIRHGTLENPRLIDVAPTLLKAAGIDNLSGLDGTVLDVF